MNVLAVDVHLTVAEMRPDHLDGLLHAGNTNARSVERDTHGVVLILEPPAPESDVEPTSGQHVDRGQLFREHHRIAVVGAKDPATDSDRRRGIGGGENRGNRREDLHPMAGGIKRRPGTDVMVSGVEDAIAEVLGLARLVAPIVSGFC